MKTMSCYWTAVFCHLYIKKQRLFSSCLLNASQITVDGQKPPNDELARGVSPWARWSVSMTGMKRGRAVGHTDKEGLEAFFLILLYSVIT